MVRCSNLKREPVIFSVMSGFVNKAALVVDSSPSVASSSYTLAISQLLRAMVIADVPAPIVATL